MKLMNRGKDCHESQPSGDAERERDEKQTMKIHNRNVTIAITDKQ